MQQPFHEVGEDEEAEFEKLPWARAKLFDLWCSVIYGCTDEQWTRFDPDAPQNPPPAPKKPMGPAKAIRMRKRPT